MKTTTILLLGLLSATAQAELYQWKDKNGVVSFSNHPGSPKSTVADTRGATRSTADPSPSQSHQYIQPSQVERQNVQAVAFRQHIDEQIADAELQLSQAHLLSTKQSMRNHLTELYRIRAGLR